MHNNRKITALLLSIFIVLSILFSALFIEYNANHDCTGENCSICSQIEVCIKTIKTMGSAMISATVIILVKAFAEIIFAAYFYVAVKYTLVQLKVKLTR